MGIQTAFSKLPLPRSFPRVDQDRCHFELPKNVFLSDDGAPQYDHISQNAYVPGCRPLYGGLEALESKCSCRALGKKDCDESCENRQLRIECVSAFHPEDLKQASKKFPGLSFPLTNCGFEQCPNRRLQLNQYPRAKPVPTRHRGYALMAMEPINKGEMVEEYIGEVITQRQSEKRLQNHARKGEKQFYHMELENDRIID